MDKQSRFPDWKKIYDSEPVEKMAWYCKELDPDLASELSARNLTQGRFIDIGSGPGTQAAELWRRGFQVTGTDLSKSAMEKAQGLYREIKFIEDDIVHSKLRGEWDFAFDRGCFHCLAPEDRSAYVQNVSKILVPQGYLFLKTFSWKESDWGYGPWRFTPDDIGEIFQGKFRMLSHKESVYQGTMPKNPLALFTVLQKSEP